jgi:hypothetical protein
MKMSSAPQAALERLIRIARGDSGQCRVVADFLLARWNAAACGGFDLTDLCAVDAAIAEDMLAVFAELRVCRRDPESLGYGEQFEAIARRCRPNLNGARCDRAASSLLLLAAEPSARSRLFPAGPTRRLPGKGFPEPKTA